MAGSSTEDLKRLAIRWMEEGWRRGDDGVVDRLHAADFRDHDASGRATGREGFKAGIRALYAAFPDFEATVEDLVIDEGAGRVAIRWRAFGTHRGSFLGVPATGRRIAFQGIEILQVHEGHITDRWGEWDGLALLEQLEGGDA